MIAAQLAGAAGVAATVEILAGSDWPGALGDGVAGWALVAAAVLTTRRSSWAWAPVAAATAWFAGTLWSPLAALHRAPVALAVLAYPRLRLRSVPALGAFALTCVAAVPGAAPTDALTVAAGAAIACAALWQRAGTHGLERRTRDASVLAAVVFSVPLTAIAAVRLGGGDLDRTGLYLYEAAVAGSVLGLALDLRRRRWAPAAVAGLVADLGAIDGPGPLRDRLAGALGDPDLKMAFRSGDGWIDTTGAALPVPSAGPNQVLTPIDEDGVLIHDAVLHEQPELLRAAAAAARLALENARLEDDVRASVAEVAASRRRLVEAADDQRRRLEAQLRAGTESELAAAAAIVARVDGAAPLTAELERARDDLRRFAHGIHPALLADYGLVAALEDVAARMPIPVALDVTEARYASAIEITAYYVCTEALANAVKHADATTVGLRIAPDGHALRVEVADDGAGGATIDADGGLQGLADRVAALSGTLSVHSPPAAGTRVAAVLPL
jgi:signal transduction histidine kinase